MNIYSGGIEVFANGRWSTVQATLWGRPSAGTAETSGTASGRREFWGGRITMKDKIAAYEVYDDEDRKLRLPNGQERTFAVSICFSRAMNIRGSGTMPFD